jgi:adenine phosphoribosyltransferase
VFSILSNPKAFALMMDLLVQRAKILAPDAILGLESRGFLFGPHIALQLQIPFVPIRKKGKLPGKVRKVTYQLEYGEVSV